jgi:hypothetical protein
LSALKARNNTRLQNKIFLDSCFLGATNAAPSALRLFT